MSSWRSAPRRSWRSRAGALVFDSLSRRAGEGARAAGVLAAALAATVASAQPAHPGIGRAATPAEVAAWDIDVRPDFKGLPKGSGSVARGQEIWEAKCASCHGIFGESNEVFSPLIGGTTAADVASGRVARLNDAAFPGRTTMMKLSSVATLWDYIHRAMPWNQPKTLSADEVYAVTAFMLNLGGVVPDNFTFSDRNIAEVQAKLPNRNGKTTAHAMWPGRSLPAALKKPDVQGSSCMRDCGPAPQVVSQLPDFARNAHGNLADQQRLVGAQRGALTDKPAPPVSAAVSALGLARKHACTACHGVDNRIVGPSLREVATRYAGRADAAEHLAARIKSGGQGVWGAIPMPPQTLPDSDARTIASWLADGAKP
jgi:S-disulfanyl-L-cysteine oxidoreductase SoxD